MIHGKIKKSLLKEFKNDLFAEMTEDINIIPIESLIKILQEESEEFDKLKNSVKIINHLYVYSRIVSKNITVFSQFNEILQNLNLIFKYYTLSKKKKLLLNDLELSKYYKKSRNKTAITDLLKKLNESLVSNKNKLQFLEEDYLQQKNQVTQIKTKIEELNTKIQELISQKKYCFNQINKITRSMSEETQEIKNDSKSISKDTGNNITNAQKIRNFQKQAKEIQYKIKKIKSKRNQTQLKLEDLNPIFESYRNDYEKALEIINNEEKKIKELQIEMKKEIRDNKETPRNDIDLIDLKSLKPLQLIKDDIEKVERELKQIKISKELIKPQKTVDLALIIQKLKELDEYLKKNKSEITIGVNEEEIFECINQFTKLENIISDIESLTNKLLSEINLLAQYRIILNDDNKSLFIDIEFIRGGKKRINFEGLTTPEKVFFIIVFYISIKLQTKHENIIFSNVSIVSKYNKAGSLYRTIRKILPLFKTDNTLFRFNLIFIISNLELKKKIKNLNIKRIHES